MKRRSTSNQSGAVSMITVVFLALLLTIITISFVRLTINEQRQAIDDDLTTRAFYAAESGIEDAKRAIEKYFEDPVAFPYSDLNADTCDAPDPFDSDGDGIVDLSPNNDLDSAYVCQKIDLSPPYVEDDLEAWQGWTIPIKAENGDPYDTIVIEWHQKGDPPNYDGLNTNTYNGPALPDVPTWLDLANNYPALLRVAIFSHDKPEPLSRDDFELNTTFAFPGSAGSGVYSVSATEISNTGNDFLAGRCNPAVAINEYVCRLEINNLNGRFNQANRTNNLRITPLYRGANVRVSILDGGNPVGFEGVQAVVDVTGRAGDVFRRVEARLALTRYYPIPDFAISATDEICKNFSLSDEESDFPSINGVVIGSCIQ